MKTIQMTIDDDLLTEVDQVTQTLQTTRSAFIRSALQLALRHYEVLQKEQQHAQGYARHPIAPDEFGIWLGEQSWGPNEPGRRILVSISTTR
jgi:hypothetical protein